MKKANQLFWLRSYTPTRLSGDGVIIAAFVYFFIAGDRSWTIGVVGMSAVLLVALRLGTYFIYLRAALARLDQMDSKMATITLSIDSLSIKSDVGASEWPWKSINKVWRFRELWLLFVGGVRSVTLPIAVLDEETQAFIIRQVSDHGGKVI